MTRSKRRRLKRRFACALLLLTVFTVAGVRAVFVLQNKFMQRQQSKAQQTITDNQQDFIEMQYNRDEDMYNVDISLPEKQYEPLPPFEESNEEQKDIPPPEIPKKYQKPVTEADLSYKDSALFLHTHGISLKNGTQYSNEEISNLLDTPMKMRFEDTNQPQVLIYHTHATESFNPTDGKIYDSRYNWRSRDNTINMVSVGNVICRELNSNNVAYLHDTQQHDYPSYNGSYKNSFDSVSAYLAENKHLKVALDVHRDAMQKDSGEIIKPTVTVNNEKYAQIMIIANCDDGSGLIPQWRENFRFAKELYLALEQEVPGICRPILLSHRKYNQQLSTGCLLIEVGGHASTLKESQRSAKVFGKALSEVVKKFNE